MFTVIETPTFVRLASDYWNDEVRTGFINFIKKLTSRFKTPPFREEPGLGGGCAAPSKPLVRGGAVQAEHSITNAPLAILKPEMLCPDQEA